MRVSSSKGGLEHFSQFQYIYAFTSLKLVVFSTLRMSYMNFNALIIICKFGNHSTLQETNTNAPIEKKTTRILPKSDNL